MSPTPTGSQGWGGLGEQWTTSCGLSRRHLGFQPPILCPQSHSILPCFSKNTWQGVSWFLRCAAHHDCFVLPFWLPRHNIIYRNQNRMALLSPRRGCRAGCGIDRSVPLQGRRGEAGHTRPWKFTHLMQVWRRMAQFQKILTIYKICVCVFFKKAHLVNTDC